MVEQYSIPEEGIQAVNDQPTLLNVGPSPKPTPAPRPKRVITFTAIGEPKAQPRARSFALRGKGGKVVMKNGQPIIMVHEAGTAENWKSQIALVAKNHVPMPPLSGPIRMDIQFLFPRPNAHYRTNGQLKPNAPIWHTKKPDRDNCEKAVTDALKVLGMFCDDCQICAGEVSKKYGPQPGATIRIEEL